MAHKGLSVFPGLVTLGKKENSSPGIMIAAVSLVLLLEFQASLWLKHKTISLLVAFGVIES